MKTSVFTVLAILVFASCCANASFAAFTLDPKESKCEIKKVPMPKVPDYLMPLYYDPEDIYIPEVICYNKKIDDAKHIIVSKRLYDRPLWGDDPLYFFYDGTFLGTFGENIAKMCNSVPLIKSEEKYGRYEFLTYRADDHINYINKGSDGTAFSVIKDKGNIIWYFEGEVPADIAITKDGRYMIATAWSVFYVYPDGDRLLSEMYSGNRVYSMIMDKPADVRILTDNIIRLQYPNGLVEHWKVRLSEEDVEKNLEKYKTDERHLADKCLLWSNGKKGGFKIQKMWCYNESDQEPTYDNTGLADITADISDVQSSVSAPAADKRPNEKAAAAPKVQNEKPEARAATGWLAGLIARVKSWFAGLFA